MLPLQLIPPIASTSRPVKGLLYELACLRTVIGNAVDLSSAVAVLAGLLVDADLATCCVLNLAHHSTTFSQKPADQLLFHLQLFNKVINRPLWRTVQEERAQCTGITWIRGSSRACQRGIHVLCGRLNSSGASANEHRAVPLRFGTLIHRDFYLVHLLDLLQRGASTTDNPSHQVLFDVKFCLYCLDFSLGNRILNRAGTETFVIGRRLGTKSQFPLFHA
mmetsp:Transcript_9923/g.27709  ORF Transcript_9923/g.27709 Transcript_9923/m.27709 type:complete len:220 (+) Transcript_9923:1578-2237(+)